VLAAREEREAAISGAAFRRHQSLDNKGVVAFAKKEKTLSCDA
jgi:hypothetical protein